MNIYLDTNILFSDPFFTSFISELLLKKTKKSEVNIYISDVSYRELFCTIEKDIKNKFRKFNGDLLNFSERYGTKDMQIQDDSNIIIEKLKSFYETKIQEEKIKIIAVESIDFEKSLNDDIKHKPPFFGEKKEEFRDSLIWQGIVRVSSIDEKSKNYLITNNTKDFYNEKNTGLSENLTKELQNIKAYKSLRELFSLEKDLQSEKNQAEFEKWFIEQKITVNRIKEEGEEYLWNHIIPKLEKRFSEYPLYLINEEYDLGYLIGKVKRDTISVIKINQTQIFENFVDIEVLLSADSETKIYTPNHSKGDFSNIEHKTMYNEFSIHLNYDKDLIFRPSEDLFIVSSSLKKN